MYQLPVAEGVAASMASGTAPAWIRTRPNVCCAYGDFVTRRTRSSVPPGKPNGSDDTKSAARPPGSLCAFTAHTRLSRCSALVTR